MLVELTLMIMLVLTIISITFGGTISGIPQQIIIDNSQIINGTTTSYYQEVEVLFYIDPLIQAIAILVVVIALVSVLGIQILGSGLSESAQHIITICILYITIWTILSLLSYALIVSIEIFGLLLYLALTIMYIIGVSNKLTNG